jgi:hypothetical protein
MTTQIPDTIFLNAKAFRLHSYPLEVYIEGSDPRPIFSASSSANWRGYVARWEIFDNRLFLTGLFGMGRMVPSHLIRELPRTPFRRAGDGPAPLLQLADLFPEEAPLVFAEWVTQLLIVPTGPRLCHGRDCFGPAHSAYCAIDVAQGRVRSYRDWNAHQWAQEKGHQWYIDEVNMNDPLTLVPPEYKQGIDERALRPRSSLDRWIGALRKPCGQMPPLQRDALEPTG